MGCGPGTDGGHWNTRIWRTLFDPIPFFPILIDHLTSLCPNKGSKTPGTEVSIASGHPRVEPCAMEAAKRHAARAPWDIEAIYIRPRGFAQHASRSRRVGLDPTGAEPGGVPSEEV
jgi:hypothetical protein